jgi:hypothetical protein
MQVEFVGPIKQINPENDNADVLLRLDDGRTFSFLVATPNNLYRCMENERLDHFFGVPPVFVKRLTVENTEKALTAVLASGEETLNLYGTLQRTDDEQKSPVTIPLGGDEALILFELLVDFYDEPALSMKDSADRIALSRLGRALEKTLAEPFMPDYKEKIEAARKRLIDAWGTLE